jgi:hypothetical protein
MVQEVDHFEAAVGLAQVQPRADNHTSALDDLLQKAHDDSDGEQVLSDARNRP